MNLSFKDYKEYSETFTPIEIEIIPTKNYNFGYSNLINNEEIKRNQIYKHEKVAKIKVILDYQIKSFEGLFRH